MEKTKLHYTDLIKGQYYSGIYNDYKCIFLCLTTGTSHGKGIQVYNKKERSYEDCYIGNNSFSAASYFLIATAEEEEHCKTCIEVKKFIPKEKLQLENYYEVY